MTTWTNRGVLRLADGTFDADDLTMGLLTATPAPATARDWNTDADIVDELTTAEVASYSRTALGTATVTEDDTADEAQLDYADVNFGILEAPAVTPSLEVTACVAINITSSEVMWVQALVEPLKTNGFIAVIQVPALGLAAVGH